MDVREDIRSVSEQLTLVRFADRTVDASLTWQLLQSLTLVYTNLGNPIKTGDLLQVRKFVRYTQCENACVLEHQIVL